MFDEMNGVIKQEVVRMLMHVDIQLEAPPPDFAERGAGREPQLPPRRRHAELRLAWRRWPRRASEASDDGLPVVEQRHVDPERDIGRNDPCWCGSGKKYKRCHGA